MQRLLNDLLNDAHVLGLSWDEFQGLTDVPWNQPGVCDFLKENFFKGFAHYQQNRGIGKVNHEPFNHERRIV
jgi:hypothetical protein